MKKIFAIAILQLSIVTASLAQDAPKKVPPPPPPQKVEKVKFAKPLPPPPPAEPAKRKKSSKKVIKFAPPRVVKDSVK